MGTNIEELPDGVGQLEKLEELNSFLCFKLEKLPTSMGSMRSLLCFYVECPLALNLPDDFSKLSSLEVLGIWNCYKFRELPNLSSLKRLRVLHIRQIEKMKEFHGLHAAEFLEELTVRYCVRLTEFSGLSNLKRLGTLKIHYCENLEEIHGLEELESLEKLSVEFCCKLNELPNLSALKRLRVLQISYCRNLEEIHGIEELESLQELKVNSCYKLTETTRKLHGQGRLLDHFSQDELSSSIAIDHGSVPILCVVFAFEPLAQKEMKGKEDLILEIRSSICFRGKEIDCNFLIKTRSKINSREAIYLHHFNVNGLFFQTKAAIEKLTVQHVGSYQRFIEVKFWKVFSENKESFQEIPNQQSSAKLVADFFEWSDIDGDEEDTDEDGDEEEEMLQESKKSLVHYHDDGETAGPSLKPSSTAIHNGRIRFK